MSDIVGRGKRSTVESRRRFAIYASSLGNYFFGEIRDLIGAGLGELGVDVQICDERRGFVEGADWHLVVAPHEFFELGVGPAFRGSRWPENVILLNTERPSANRFALAEQCFSRARLIWDIDFESSLLIRRKGYDCSYLPLGYAESSELFGEVDCLPLHEGTRALEPAVREWDRSTGTWNDRPLRALFLGRSSSRRESFFARHADWLSRFGGYIHQCSVGQPLIPGRTTDMDTRTSVGLAQRSRVLLNVHYGAKECFEWHRIVLLGIAQRTLVVTEPCSLAPPFRANLDYVEAPLDQLAERVEYYLSSPSGAKEAQEIIDHGHATLTRRCRLRDTLRPLVERLSDSRAVDWLRSWAVMPAASGPVKPQRPLEVCVVVPDVTGEGPEADQGSAQVELGRVLAEAGHSVTVLHCGDDYGEGRSMGELYLWFAGRGIEYVALPREPLPPHDPAEPLTRSYAVWRWLRARSFDVAHFPDSLGSAFCSLLGKRQGLGLERTFLSVNAQAPRPWRRSLDKQFQRPPLEEEIEFMERESICSADALVMASRSLFEWMAGQGWRLPEARAVLPPLLSLLAPGGGGAGGVVREIVFVGSLEEGSGLGLFCDAIDRLEPGELQGLAVTFLGRSGAVAGRSSRCYLRERSRRWSCPWRVLDTLGLGERRTYLEQAGKLAVFAGYFPGEARWCLARGVPFLAADLGGIGEMIEAADRGRVLFPASAQGLALGVRGALGSAEAVKSVVDPREAEQFWVHWHEELSLPAPVEMRGVPEPLVRGGLADQGCPPHLVRAVESLMARDCSGFEAGLTPGGRSKLRVGYLAFEPDSFAGPHIRLRSVLSHLSERGGLELVQAGGMREGRLTLENLDRLDVLVVRRQMAAILPFPELKRQLDGRDVKVVYDIDDALTQLPEWHKAHGAYAAARPKLEEYLSGADLVTVSTPLLKALYGTFNANVRVLPNALDPALWEGAPPRRKDEVVRILFSGSLDHERDLRLIEPALLSILANHPGKVEFLYWGNVTEALRSHPQVRSAGEFTPSYAEYSGRLRELDVSFAVAPLEDIPFNRGKSPIRWLEYAVCGIPGVFSDMPAYNQVVVDGETGLLVANTVEAWSTALARMVKDARFRGEVANRARSAVLSRHLIEHEAGQWLEAYQTVATQASTPTLMGSVRNPFLNELSLTGRSVGAMREGPAGEQENVVVDDGSAGGSSRPMAVPAVGRVGGLGRARERVRRKEWVGAWTLVVEALSVRPFNPEAYLLLAEIAWQAGNQELVKRCVARAEGLAPCWNAAGRFLEQHPSGDGRARVELPELPEETEPRLTVCMIARNEEAFLGGSLNSVRDHAWQVVVVDTGSTDRTMEIAREFGAEVHEMEWGEDFSAARNEALRHARGDWVLILDADEELTGALDLGKRGVMAYRLPVVEEGKEENGCDYLPRLFRNAPGLFFVGRVHEEVFSSMEARRREWDLENKLGDATLLHRGRSKSVVEDCANAGRDLRLLELAVEDLPGDPNLLMNLGLEFVRSGRVSEGLTRYWDAVGALLSRPEEEVVPELRESLLTQMCSHLTAYRQPAGLARLLETRLARGGPMTASMHFALGLALFELNRHAEAAENFRQCVAKRDQWVLRVVNKEIRSGAPRDRLAVCLGQLLAANAARLIPTINDGTGDLEQLLPAAAEVLEAALLEAG